MATTCHVCGRTFESEARVLAVRPEGPGALPTLHEAAAPAARDGAVAYLCPDHTAAVGLLRTIIADAGEAEGRIRGHLFQELDLLAFALEMEADRALAEGREDEADRAQQTRLGIRLAQRLVGAVPAPEVDRRLQRWRSEYRSKFPPAG